MSEASEEGERWGGCEEDGWDNLECLHPPRRERDLGEPAPGPPPRTNKARLNGARSTRLRGRAASFAEHSKAHAAACTVLHSSSRQR